MAANKSAFIRYRTIDECLTNKMHKYPTKSFIHQKCCDAVDQQISLSTLEKDIQDIRYDDRLGFFAPIKYCKASNSYFYSEPDYTINKMILTKAQMKCLEQAALALEAISRYFGDFRQLCK